MPSRPGCDPVPERAQLAADQPPGPDQPVQHAGHHRHPEPEPGRALGRRERAVRAGVAQHQVAQRIRHRLGERLRHPDRQRGPERVAHPAGVLDRQPALLAADPHPDRPPRRLQRVEPLRAHPAGRGLGGGQVAEEAQQVGRALDVAGVPVRRQPLQRRLDLGQHLGVEQLADRLRAEQLGQQRGVQRQRRGPPLGQRRVGLVEEHPDVAEQQAARERRGRRRGQLHHLHLPRRHVGHQLAQPGQVVDVLHALAHRLEGDRELLVAPGHREQLGRALALLPERAAPLRVPARQQQRPRRALPEPGRVQRRRAQLGDHDLLHLARVEQHVLRGGHDLRPGRRPRRPAAAARCRRRPRRRAPPPRAAPASGPRWPAPTAR